MRKSFTEKMEAVKFILSQAGYPPENLDSLVRQILMGQTFAEGLSSLLKATKDIEDQFGSSAMVRTSTGVLALGLIEATLLCPEWGLAVLGKVPSELSRDTAAGDWLDNMQVTASRNIGSEVDSHE